MKKFLQFEVLRRFILRKKIQLVVLEEKDFEYREQKTKITMFL